MSTKLSTITFLCFLYANQLFAYSFVLESKKDRYSVDISQLRSQKDLYTSKLIEDPHVTKAPIAFEGVYLHRLLEKYFGKQWLRNQSVVFEASDGYKVKIETVIINKYEPILAFGIAGKKEFSFADEYQQGKIQELGPLYLVWDLARFPDLQKEGSTQNWPYKIVKVSLLESYQFAKELVPDENLDKKDPIWLGFESYKKHCFTCHTLNENNPHGAPSSQNIFQMLSVRDKAWLEKYLQNPRAWTPSSSMPSLVLPKETIENIRTYSINKASKI